VVYKPIKSIAVYICTHQRNDPLLKMLNSLEKSAKNVQPEVEVAVVVVDDNPDGRAKPLVESLENNFIRGLHYVKSGSQNISIARNLGIEKAVSLADWVGMVDDDQTVTEEWFLALIKTQQENNSDAVTGPVFLRYEESSPKWLSSQPFSEILEAQPRPEGTQVEVCSTGNSMISSKFLLENDTIRFREDLGVLGGEDMVFYKEATSAGLKAHYSTNAISYGEQPLERSNLKYQLRTSYWMGNTEYLTNVESGSATRFRMILRASKRVLKYVSRPITRAVKFRSPQFRFSLAGIAQTLGILAGVIGMKVKHPD